MGTELPEGWRVATLGEVGQILKARGGTKKDDAPEGTPVIRYGEIYSRHDTKVRKFYSFVSPEAAGVYTPLRRGDILFAGSGETLAEIGKATLFDGPEPALGGGDILIVRPAAGVMPLFLVYAVSTPDATTQKMRIGQGSSVFHLYSDGLETLRVWLPPLAEQKKIAQILSSVDEAIQATQAVIDQTRRVKEAMLQTLLTRGLGHTRFQQTEIGEIPEGWEVRRLDEMLSDGPRNGVYKPANEIGEGVMIIGQTAFTEDRLIDYSMTRRARASETDLERFGLAEGDVLVTRVYATPEGCGRPAFVRGLPEPAMFESNMMRLRANPLYVLPEFLFYWLQVSTVRAYLMSRASSSNQTSINQATLGAVPLPLVPLAEQRHAVTIINALHNAIRSTSTALTQLQSVKSALLQTLLSGQTRVTP